MTGKQSRETRMVRKISTNPDVRTPIGTNVYLPNQSGDHSSGRQLTTPTTDTEIANKKYVDDNAGGTPEGTAVLSTGEGGATKFLREDGDGTCSWQATSAHTPEGTAVLSTGEGGGTKFLREDGDGTSSWQAAGSGTPEGTAVLSTGETGAVKVLREDGDDSCSWQPVPGGDGHIFIGLFTPDSIGAGSWSVSHNASSAYSFTIQNAGSDADNMTYKAYLAAGTYSYAMIVTQHTDSGKVEVQFDGSVKGTHDLYGSTTENIEFRVNSISVATSGLASVKLNINGKNASSSGFVARFHSLTIWRTA